MSTQSIIGLAMGILVAATGAWATTYQGPAVEYAADQHMSAEGHQAVAKVFHAHQKLRMESQQAVTITRLDKKVVWILMPQMSAYQEHAIDDPKFGAKTPEMGGDNVQLTPLGTETVNGVSTTKNKMVSTDPQGRKVEGLMWVSKEGIMIRGIFTDPAQGGQPVTIDLKNLRISKQDPNLFEIPAGYNKMPAMGMGAYPPAGPAAMPPPPQDPADTTDDHKDAGTAPQDQDQAGRALKEALDSVNKLKGLFGPNP